MNLSVGILEFLNIAEACYVLDRIVKTYPLSVLKAQKICPGHFLLILSGNTSDILAMAEFYSSEHFPKIKLSCVTGISSECIQAISRTKCFHTVDNLGIIEAKNAVHSFLVLDTLVKSFPIRILRLDFSMGLFGKCILVFCGTLSDIESAIKESYLVREPGDIVDARIIPSPNQEVITWFAS